MYVAGPDPQNKNIRVFKTQLVNKFGSDRVSPCLK